MSTVGPLPSRVIKSPSVNFEANLFEFPGCPNVGVEGPASAPRWAAAVSDSPIPFRCFQKVRADSIVNISTLLARLDLGHRSKAKRNIQPFERQKCFRPGTGPQHAGDRLKHQLPFVTCRYVSGSQKGARVSGLPDYDRRCLGSDAKST